MDDGDRDAGVHEGEPEQGVRAHLVGRDRLVQARQEAPGVEGVDPATISGVTKVTLFHWNRRYPSDLVSTFDFGDFELVETKEFAGSSHELITEETWARVR